MFLKNKNIRSSSKIKISKVTDYATLIHIRLEYEKNETLNFEDLGAVLCDELIKLISNEP